MPHTRTIVLVGHCGPDNYLLESAASRAVPGAMIAAVNDQQALDPHLSGRSLLLVNRVLDGQFESENGVKLIERIHVQPDPPALMLISNFEDAQAAAMAAGALPGFGKLQMLSASTKAKLRAAAIMDSSDATLPLKD